MTSLNLARRPGPRPRTTSTNPHSQLDQQPADDSIRSVLAEALFGLDGVVESPSRISVPGARALCLGPDVARGPADAFMIGTEFLHLHPPPDLSLHAMLPVSVAREAIDLGWAELHIAAAAGVIPLTAVLIYAPRDLVELTTVLVLAVESYRFAKGQTAFADDLKEEAARVRSD